MLPTNMLKHALDVFTGVLRWVNCITYLWSGFGRFSPLAFPPQRNASFKTSRRECYDTIRSPVYSKAQFILSPKY